MDQCNLWNGNDGNGRTDRHWYIIVLQHWYNWAVRVRLTSSLLHPVMLVKLIKTAGLTLNGVYMTPSLMVLVSGSRR